MPTTIKLKNPRTVRKAMARAQARIKREMPKAIAKLMAGEGEQRITFEERRRGKLAWAIVHKGGKIEVETVSETASRCRDNLNMLDEEQGAKVRRVRVVPAW